MRENAKILWSWFHIGSCTGGPSPEPDWTTEDAEVHRGIAGKCEKLYGLGSVLELILAVHTRAILEMRFFVGIPLCDPVSSVVKICG